MRVFYDFALEIFKSNIFQTILGVVVGGIITILVNRISNKETIRMNYKLEIADETHDICMKILEDIITFEADYLSDCKSELLAKEVVAYQNLIAKLAFMCSKLDIAITRYCFIIPEIYDYDREISDLVKEMILDEDNGIEHIKDCIMEFKDKVMFLEKKLQLDLMSGIIRKRDLKRTEKVLGRGFDENH